MSQLHIGLRSNNPGNIRSVGSVKWQGQVGTNEKGFCIVDTMENGIRALSKQIIVYQERYNLYTVREIINRWAPPVENNTSIYVTAVCHLLECDPDDRFDFRNDDFLFWIATAIGMHENGPKAFTETVSMECLPEAGSWGN